MWRPRDRERFIGGYDPEHEMPDPDREAGDRWQSDAYRHASRDSRFAYRMNPDRFEERFQGRDPRDDQYRWSRDARDLDRGGYRGGMDEGNYGGGGYGYGGGGRPHYGSGPYGGSDRGWDRGGYGGGGYGSGSYGSGGYGGGYGRDFDRGGYDRGFDRGPHFDRDRIYGSDRGWDYGREHDRDRYGRGTTDREGWDRDRWDRDRWRR